MQKLPMVSSVWTSVALLSVFGCSPDDISRPKLRPQLRSALLDAPSILQKAEAGTLGRGEQDRLVRFERDLPGFGGLYITNGKVTVFMKTGATSREAVRATLSRAYSAHPNPEVREAMALVANATVIQGRYALSELIATQKRVVEILSGWTAAGTDIMANKIVVGFADSAALRSGLAEIESAGIPSEALKTIILPEASLGALYFNSLVRPTRAGLYFSLQNDSYEPHSLKQVDGMWVPQYYGAMCSLGFNVQATGGTNYFMTAGHCENAWRGLNGATGDSVFQPSRLGGAPSGFIGTITVNPPWTPGSSCPTTNGVPYDFCTDADVALGQYIVGVSGERKVATSTTGGVNGYPGSAQINGFYPINAVLSPEYVNRDMHHEVAKSGGTTYTTSGPFLSEMADIAVTTCWPNTFTWGCGGVRSVLLQSQTVIQAKMSGGDSGGAVFTGNPGNGAPYAALGILTGFFSPPNQALPSQRCQTCRFFFSRWDRIEARVNLGVLNPQTVF